MPTTGKHVRPGRADSEDNGNNLRRCWNWSRRLASDLFSSSVEEGKRGGGQREDEGEDRQLACHG